MFAIGGGYLEHYGLAFFQGDRVRAEFEILGRDMNYPLDRHRIREGNSYHGQEFQIQQIGRAHV